MPALQFECRLESDRGACFIRVPPEVLTALDAGKRARVKGDHQRLSLTDHRCRLRWEVLPRRALRAALGAEPASAAVFEKLSYTRQAGVRSVGDRAKRVETQRRRMEQATGMPRGRRGR